MHIYQFYLVIMLIFLLPDRSVSYFIFSSIILSSIFMISFYILSKRFFLKREELSDARVVSITEKEHGFAVHFL